jgi:hypothetical protein
LPGLDKDLREELDTKQATADGAIYASFALFFSAALWAAYQVLPVYSPLQVWHLPSFVPPWVVALSFFASACLCYRVSLYSQAQYGESFKSIFDVHHSKLVIAGVIKRVAEVTNDNSLLTSDRRKQLKVAWRYLHNYKVKCPYASCEKLEPMSPVDFSKHNTDVHSAPGAIPQNQQDFVDHYYPTLAKAAKTDLRVSLIHRVALSLWVLAIGIAFYKQWMTVLFASILLGLASYFLEVRFRTRQKEHVVKVTGIARAFSKPEIYFSPARSVWLSSAMNLPLFIIVLGTLLLLLLIRVGLITM